MEFNMLTFTKQESILIAVTLAITLSVPLLVPTFYGLSTITLDHADDRLGQLSERNKAGDVQLRGSGLYCGPSSGFSI
jgi:hypothetical protein